MSILTERALAKMAAAVAKDLVDRKIPLNDSVEKLAELHELNAEQVARLCEASNNAAFNAAFEARGKQGSEDRLVEFPVADTKVVLAKRAGALKTAAVRKSAVPTFDAVWESRPLEAPAPAAEKTAAAEPLFPAQRRRRGEPTHQVLEELHVDKLACMYRCKGALEKIATHFRADVQRPAYVEFEKDAMALHGAQVDGFLDILREQIRLPAVSRDHSKVASRLVDSATTPEHTLLKEALEAYSKSLDIQRALERHGRG